VISEDGFALGVALDPSGFAAGAGSGCACVIGGVIVGKAMGVRLLLAPTVEGWAFSAVDGVFA